MYSGNSIFCLFAPESTGALPYPVPSGDKSIYKMQDFYVSLSSFSFETFSININVTVSVWNIVFHNFTTIFLHVEEIRATRIKKNPSNCSAIVCRSTTCCCSLLVWLEHG